MEGMKEGRKKEKDLQLEMYKRLIKKILNYAG